MNTNQNEQKTFMTFEKFEELLDSVENPGWEGDNALLGCIILNKYIKHVIQGAGKDQIYGPDVAELIEAGITEEDVIELSRLNWMISEGTYLSCSV